MEKLLELLEGKFQEFLEEKLLKLLEKKPRKTDENHGEKVACLLTVAFLFPISD
jgi:hypothetical protein